MNSMDRWKPAAVAAAPEWGGSPGDSLENLLASAERFGNIQLMRHDDGHYSASVDMHVKATGVTFKVKAEYHTHKTPRAAVVQMLERAEAAVRAMSGGVT